MMDTLKIFLSKITEPISVCQKCSLGETLSRFSSSRHDALKKKNTAARLGGCGGGGVGVVCKSVCSGEQYRTMMVLLLAHLRAQDELL